MLAKAVATEVRYSAVQCSAVQCSASCHLLFMLSSLDSNACHLFVKSLSVKDAIPHH